MYQIRDTVHGNITLEYIYADIVDTPEFQRLRSIEQGSFRPVFPGARHDRFIHSLGTYHLATRFAAHFFENLAADVPGYCLSANEQKSLTATFRYAALLHDIGHAPYSHTTEDFFALKKNEAGESVIREELRGAIASLNDPAETAAFDLDFASCKPAPHEIISATLLITERAKFLGRRKARIDLALAARMVVGCTYDYNRYAHLDDHGKQLLGVRNCLIRLLNSNAVDVDRLDYLLRDTRMSGFANTPVDADQLAAAVTAVALPGGAWLYPAFHNDALGVLESMFHAKREHDFWVLSHPSGAYDAALRAHCISRLEAVPGCRDYLTTVFSTKALGRGGVKLAGKTYRLLCDDDIGADLKRQYAMDPLFRELFSRDTRRIAVWKDYYEYRWLFHDPDSGVTESDVFAFFRPLMAVMKEKRIFVLNSGACSRICSDPAVPEGAKEAALFLRDFFTALTPKPAPDGEPEQSAFDVVLLPRSSLFSYKFDPETTYICFTRQPARGGRNYAPFSFLKHGGATDKRDLFYLYTPKFIMPAEQKKAFRDALMARLKPAPVLPKV